MNKLEKLEKELEEIREEHRLAQARALRRQRAELRALEARRKAETFFEGLFRPTPAPRWGSTSTRVSREEEEWARNQKFMPTANDTFATGLVKFALGVAAGCAEESIRRRRFDKAAEGLGRREKERLWSIAEDLNDAEFHAFLREVATKPRTWF
jgi:hypothetical protein